MISDNPLDVELALAAFRRMRLPSTVRVAPSGDRALSGRAIGEYWLTLNVCPRWGASPTEP